MSSETGLFNDDVDDHDADDNDDNDEDKGPQFSIACRILSHAAEFVVLPRK